MARVIYDLVKGSNEPIVIQLYPVETDTGSNGIDLTGVSNLAATAKHVESGAKKNFSAVAVQGSPVNGTVALNFDTTTFTDIGVYDVQITFTDPAAKVRAYPSDGAGLRIRVNDSN